MGCTDSVQLPQHFLDFSSWPSQKVSALIKAYVDGEYDYGIDHTVVMALTGFSLESSKVLIKALSRGDGIVINATSFLTAVIMLSEPNRRQEFNQLNLIFEVFDFSMSGALTFDEFSMMLLMVASTQALIIDLPNQIPNDETIINISNAMFNAIGKNKSSTITLVEVCNLFKEYFSSHGQICIDQIFDRFCMGTSCLEWPVDDEEEKK